MIRVCRFFLVAALVAVSHPLLSYTDHRGHNLDSLERAVARWTPQAVDGASDAELFQLNRDYRDLMLGYVQLNGEKSRYYALKALEISTRKGWESANADAWRYIGQIFWGGEQYDSSLVYYRKALGAVERMQAGAVSFSNPEGYSQKEIDDNLSALYGSIGNLYNMMDSIPQAMAWYAKAGEIFDRYGWHQSNAVLYYNIGETWMEQGEPKKAQQAYEKSLQYAAGDSLWVATAQKGLGRAYMAMGRTWKALRLLHRADEYYSAHSREELNFTKENYEYMSDALLAQRRQLALMASGVLLILLLAVASLLLAGRLRIVRKEKTEVAEVLQEAIDELPHSVSGEQIPSLSDREKDILDLLAKGYTTPQIAEALFLSPETIKWYRKKLLVKFDVANTAELLSITKDAGII